MPGIWTCGRILIGRSLSKRFRLEAGRSHKLEFTSWSVDANATKCRQMVTISTEAEMFWPENGDASMFLVLAQRKIARLFGTAAVFSVFLV